MYLHALMSHLAPSIFAHRWGRSTTLQTLSRGEAKDLAALTDQQLRDIGYVRERTFAPRRHILWM
ncbi:MAG: hypothetical protein AB7I79_06315 [Rhizobiaceae bacterium]